MAKESDNAVRRRKSDELARLLFLSATWAFDFGFRRTDHASAMRRVHYPWRWPCHIHENPEQSFDAARAEGIEMIAG